MGPARGAHKRRRGRRSGHRDRGAKAVINRRDLIRMQRRGRLIPAARAIDPGVRGGEEAGHGHDRWRRRTGHEKQSQIGCFFLP